MGEKGEEGGGCWGGRGGKEGGKEVYLRYGLRLIKYKPGWGVPKQAPAIKAYLFAPRAIFCELSIQRWCQNIE